MAEKKNKILVVDDEKEIRDILTLLLGGEGYQVVTDVYKRQALTCMIHRPILSKR